jgi:hypothetical protein
MYVLYHVFKEVVKSKKVKFNTLFIFKCYSLSKLGVKARKAGNYIMEKYIKILHEVHNQFREEQKENCQKAKQVIENKTGFKIRVNTGASTGGVEGKIEYNTYIHIEVIEDETDYKYLDIPFKVVQNNMKNGIPFEQAIFNELIFTMLHENGRIREYKCNIWEKLLDVYIRNTNCLPDGYGYYFHEHELHRYELGNESEGSEEVLFAENILGIDFGTEEIVIYVNIDEDCQKVVISSDGIRRE